SNSKACAYVGIQAPNETITWGAGIHDDIIEASVLALISALNKIDF
ncbi:MAG: 2-isopropylmalate synthase, partial [Firmicutes bacterium]|nr:2-isopropylmalate synthase [Candidatus Scybalomonas excrementavium]